MVTWMIDEWQNGHCDTNSGNGNRGNASNDDNNSNIRPKSNCDTNSDKDTQQ